jgi:VIT1/CCC1 family predicted Fe2+/Mn2+ transporter
MEPHGRNFEYLYPATLGIADGITVPFAVTASLTVLNDRHVVVVGRLAELFAGAISMGLGQFMTALLKREHYLSEEAREKNEIACKPEEEAAEIHDILGQYGVSYSGARTVVDDLKASPSLYLQVCYDKDRSCGIMRIR